MPSGERQRSGNAQLLQLYNEIFEEIPADTPVLLEECFRIRHQVYCREKKFFDADDDSGVETDAYDERSLHGLLRHRKSGAFVGTIRLILPAADQGPTSLPLYRLWDAAGLPLSDLPPIAGMAEISRFAISKRFRQRADDGLYGYAYDADELARDERRMIPHLSLGLMRLALRLGSGRGIRGACAIMEPTLVRLLARLGIHWQAVGPMIDCYGACQPCVARVDDLLGQLEAERPEVWQVITAGGTCGA